MLLEHLKTKLDAIEARGQYRVQCVTQTPTAPQQTLTGPDGSPQARLMFCSNDYLGLASHSALAVALAEGAQRWAGGAGASHLVSGHTGAHEELARTLAQWFEPHVPQAKCLGFSTGYMANLAVIATLGDADTDMFSDALNHASLIDGMRLAKASVQRYAHVDMAALRAQLMLSRAKVKLIVSDTVFSMDGDLAPVPELLRLAEEFDAWLILDDAHGFGVLGQRGRGTLEHFGLASERIILLGTLGKAAGLSGAFVVAHERIIAYLLQAARPYIFTTASLPAVNHALLTSLGLIEGDSGQHRRSRLQALQQQFRAGVEALLRQYPTLPWRLLASITPIQALVVGRNEDVMALSKALDEVGLRVPGIRPPTVAEGQARLRITLCATHTAADVARLLQALFMLASTQVGL
ncbi:8-amino-7-oxononanoate synthase [Curvibacter sp. RS43]|uniref:aminotransferase class I/II-fold pyridoxal phosphate-dependent enzyme n=1 Tax=Curvibacter microcysteis TaxID=3026419 RepID=UPI00235ED7EC|nr:8-amino-7-oxononanoate synthase [Curvibacter sp. RS43]MDD0812935.1 8-amino-7-oxononanoate synthase [Curvibacter sp. RS43]